MNHRNITVLPGELPTYTGEQKNLSLPSLLYIESSTSTIARPSVTRDVITAQQVRLKRPCNMPYPTL